MNLIKKQIILIAIAVVIIGTVAATIFVGPNLTTSEKNLLILAVDPSEAKEGMGSRYGIYY